MSTANGAAQRRSPASPILGALLLLTALSACPKKTDVSFASPPPDGTEVTCPVTGERCVKGPSTPAAVVEERTFYFCSDEAARAFAAEHR